MTTNRASHTSADLLGYFPPDEFATWALPGGRFRGGMRRPAKRKRVDWGLEDEAYALN